MSSMGDQTTIRLPKVLVNRLEVASGLGEQNVSNAKMFGYLAAVALPKQRKNIVETLGLDNQLVDLLIDANLSSQMKIEGDRRHDDLTAALNHEQTVDQHLLELRKAISRLDENLLQRSNNIDRNLAAVYLPITAIAANKWLGDVDLDNPIALHTILTDRTRDVADTVIRQSVDEQRARRHKEGL